MTSDKTGKREMSFEEEFEILANEGDKLFRDEEPSAEPPFANCIVRRAFRCIGKLLEKLNKYEVIGTVEECKVYKEKAQKRLDTWLDDVYTDVIDKFAEALKMRYPLCSNDFGHKINDSLHKEIDRIAEQLKAGGKDE